MKTLQKLADPDLLTQGIFPSLAPNQLALWRDGENVRFQEGRAVKSGGYLIEPTSLIVGHATYDIVAFAQTFADDARRIFYGTTNGYNSLNLYDDGAWRSLGSGYLDGRWQLTTFGTWLLATNNADSPLIWKDTLGNAVTLGGLNFLRAKIITKNQNHVIVMNLDTGGQRIQWSKISDPETWTPIITGDTANDAGGIDIRDLDGDIYAAADIGADIAFYSQDSMGLMHYTGDQLVFSCKVILNGIGAVGPNAVVTRGTYNYGLGRKGFWLTDGLTIDYIHSPQVKRWLDDNIDWLAAEEVVSLHNERLTTIEWHFKCLDGQIRGLAYNYGKPGWTKLTFPITAAIEQQVFPFPVVATGRGFSFYGDDVDQNEAGMNSWLRTALFDANLTDQYKIWDGVRLVLKYEGYVEIRFGFVEEPSDDEDITIEWTAWQAAVNGDNFIPQQREAMYACFEIRSTETLAYWEISGINILGEAGGWL